MQTTDKSTQNVEVHSNSAVGELAIHLSIHASSTGILFILQANQGPGNDWRASISMTIDWRRSKTVSKRSMVSKSITNRLKDKQSMTNILRTGQGPIVWRKSKSRPSRLKDKQIKIQSNGGQALKSMANRLKDKQIKDQSIEGHKLK